MLLPRCLHTVVSETQARHAHMACPHAKGACITVAGAPALESLLMGSQVACGWGSLLCAGTSIICARKRERLARNLTRRAAAKGAVRPQKQSHCSEECCRAVGLRSSLHIIDHLSICRDGDAHAAGPAGCSCTGHHSR